ncbi:MAG: tRNA (uridine(34)/cytosine(34)/5-carboxymethylaminomethyluridine(34)-2'-O)-methyltransferase TrmL [Candidatus Aminicenantes bacterium]|nr:tRNA (uridine(34)/cytosine(34)/5-carboxymethylaminomethyluridine(34)-2'-O)-methyltransferase TrmL [Candidatus Aminicenantes bacterium]
MKSLHVVLHQPEIPQNTGNIARTCAAVGAKLHLIKPLGFSTDDRYLKRAGLDYWNLVEVFSHDSLAELFTQHPDGSFAFITKTASRSYDKIQMDGDIFLIFGSETKGLPGPLLAQNKDRCFRIPIVKDARSLNLSNAVAVVVYEVLQHHKFLGLEISGDKAASED